VPSSKIIQGVLNLVPDLAPDRLKVLDVSCKRGEVLRSLATRGFDVRGTNYESGLPPIEGIPIDGGVDLARALPYPDASFDLVLLTEVIEHVENHKVAICELGRVIKPGGRLIITTPNIMRLDSRLAFLLSGLHKSKRRQMPLDTPLGAMHRFHNFPITFPILYYLLRQNGLEIDRLPSLWSALSDGCREHRLSPDSARAPQRRVGTEPRDDEVDAGSQNADGGHALDQSEKAATAKVVTRFAVRTPFENLL
jgi:SAM-dependent methyltransferase